MKKIYTLLLFSLSIIIFSQNLSLLDEKNGFKTIKLGTPISEFKEYKERYQTDNEIVYIYNPSDSNLKELFSQKFQSLELGFDKKSELLVAIILRNQFDNIIGNCYNDSLQKLDITKNNITQVLGKPTNNINDTKEGFGYAWSANKVELVILATISKLDLDKNYNTISSCSNIVMFNKKNIIDKSGF